MRILHLISRYWPAIGGAEAHLGQISARLAAAGHQVTVLTTDAHDHDLLWNPRRRRFPLAEETHQGQRLLRFPVRHVPLAPASYTALRIGLRLASTYRLLPLASLFRLARFSPWVPGLCRWLAETHEQFDIVAGMMVLYEPVMEAGWRFARSHGLPFIIYPLTHLGAGPRPAADNVSRYYTMRHQTAIVKDSDAVIAQTAAERDFYTGRGADPARICVVGPGIDPAEVAGGDGPAFRERHGLRGPLVAFVGAMTPDKGALHLVQAIEKLQQDGGQAAPYLVLAGAVSQPFERFMGDASPSLRERVRVLGRVSEQEKRDLLAACDVFAMPSRTDSFGISFLEAWLYRKPVVGSTAWGMDSVIADGRDGLLAPFGDVPALAAAIHRLLADPAQAALAGAHGQRKVLDHHTWDHKFGQIHDIYQRLADG